MASDCPEPEVCRRCRQEGHVKVFHNVLNAFNVDVIRMIARSLRSALTAAKKAIAAQTVPNQSSAESAGNL